MKKLRPYQEKAVQELKKHNKGKVIFPTGAGKTVVMLEDAKQRIQSSNSALTFVIVAPKILLSTQLEIQFKSYLKGEDIFCTRVHSGEHGVTKIEELNLLNTIFKKAGKHHLLFTTYQSLTKINNSGIGIDFCYFDEAHHSTKKSNFVGVAQTSHISKNTFFFTATPKHNDTETSMCNSTVYGGNIITVPATDLVSNGYIIPPRVQTYVSESTRTKENAAFVDSENVINFLDSVDIENPKVLVASYSTRVIMDMITETDLLEILKERGFTIFHITSKYGAFIENKSVSRELFFKKLDELGAQEDSKFIVFHHSIISEGIDVSGMNCALLLRNLPYVDMAQTIGRVIRMNKEDYQDIENGKIKPGDFNNYRKPFGVVAVPVQNNFGHLIEKKLQSVVDTIFIKGETLVA
jgi:superfamily II DNA or RNA helicase